MRFRIGSVNYELISKSGLIIITGKPETVDFCREAADLIKAHNEQMGTLWDCETLTEFEHKARVPAFLGRWWYTGSADNISASDKRALEKLIKNPVEHGTAILTGTDFNKYRNATRGLDRAPQAHEIATSFPNEKYLIKFVQRKITSKGYKIAYGSAERFIRRLGVLYSKYDYYIDILLTNIPEGVVEVSRDTIDRVLKGVTGASFETFMRQLINPLSNVNLARTVGMFKSYSIVKEEGPAKVLRRVHYKALQYMEIRRLINAGYLPVGVTYSVEAFSKLLDLKEDDTEDTVGKKKKASNKFTYKDILKWSDSKLNREITMASEAPLSDWFVIAALSDVPFATDAEAERILFDIMTRSRRTV